MYMFYILYHCDQLLYIFSIIVFMYKLLKNKAAFSFFLYGINYNKNFELFAVNLSVSIISTKIFEPFCRTERVMLAPLSCHFAFNKTQHPLPVKRNISGKFYNI